MKPTTKRALLRLKELTTAGDQNIFERLQLADSVTKDDNYLVTEFHGDQDKAMSYLENEYFLSLAGYIKLHKMLSIFRHFPTEAAWKEHRYNIRAMEILWDDTQKEAAATKPKTSERATKAQVAELEAELKESTYALKRERDQLQTKEQKIAELEGLVRDLGLRVATLEGELRAYKSSEKLAAAA